MALRHPSMTAGASTSIDLSAPSYFKLHLNPDHTRNAGLVSASLIELIKGCCGSVLPGSLWLVSQGALTTYPNSISREKVPVMEDQLSKSTMISRREGVARYGQETAPVGAVGLG
jgi:hypothetical protein